MTAKHECPMARTAMAKGGHVSRSGAVGVRGAVKMLLRARVDRAGLGAPRSFGGSVALGGSRSRRPGWARPGRPQVVVALAISKPEEHECDVCIVGGGPAGCTCALYTSRAQLKTVVLDKNNTTGALAITSTIANYPGLDKTMPGQQLLDEMVKQAVDYGTDYRRAQVFLVDTQGEYKYVYTPDATFKSRALVLASGAMGRKATFKGEDTYLGRGVSYCATCDGAFYRGAEVAVVGVTQEAVEEAQFLTKFAGTVHWITVKDPVGVPFADDLLACDNVKHWNSSRLVSIDGDDSGVTGIRLKQRGAESEESLDVTGVFVYVAGQLPITDFCQASGLEFNEEGNHESGIKVNDEMATNQPGVYAIGDIRNTPYKQVVVAAADGCIAAMAIDKYLKGRKNVKVDWVHN